MSKKTNKSIYIAAMVLFLGGLGYLLWSGLSENSTYFLNVSEALAMEQESLDRARLFGKVSPENLETTPGALGVDFDLVDKVDGAKMLRVEYQGAVPDTFKPGVEVIVEGKFDHGNRVFTATSLVTKCPSKYREQSAEMEKSQG
jgi:cytochrome c-type biogenesis protein CcmE